MLYSWWKSISNLSSCNAKLKIIGTFHTLIQHIVETSYSNLYFTNLAGKIWTTLFG